MWVLGTHSSYALSFRLFLTCIIDTVVFYLPVNELHNYALICYVSHDCVCVSKMKDADFVDLQLFLCICIRSCSMIEFAGHSLSSKTVEQSII